ncbi:hypothetical protein PDTK01_30810 [Phycicoccus sp. DTK01]|nr:hypothetical protein PDTK01_30810 [Phycicoccus sp. DTK01]
MSRDLESLLAEAERDAADGMTFDLNLALRSIELALEREELARDRERDDRDRSDG